MVKLAGLAVASSGELTLGRLLLSPALEDNVTVPPWMRRSTVQNRMPPEVLLQVNVTFPLSGTTYPPGIGKASAESVTEEDNQANTQCGKTFNTQIAFLIIMLTSMFYSFALLCFFKHTGQMKKVNIKGVDYIYIT